MPLKTGILPGLSVGASRRFQDGCLEDFERNSRYVRCPASTADAEIVVDIARDAAACIRNAEQLEALQALIRANTK